MNELRNERKGACDPAAPTSSPAAVAARHSGAAAPIHPVATAHGTGAAPPTLPTPSAPLLPMATAVPVETLKTGHHAAPGCG